MKRCGRGFPRFALIVSTCLVGFLTNLQSGEILLIGSAVAAHADCPEPWVNRGRQCILKKDGTLDHTVEAAAFAHYNCDGHSLSPDAENPPQLAFFLNEAYGVHIKNCLIEGFDFGILAVNAKAPEDRKDDPEWIEENQIKIFNNSIEANNVPIHLMSVDHALILKNRISHFRKGGVGIIARYNSDFNQIKKNEINSAFTSDAAAVTRVPGFVIPPERPIPNPTSSNPNFNAAGGFAGSAILISETEGADPTVFTAIINQTLYQFTASQNPEGGEDFPGDNRVEGNNISLSHSGRAMDTGILFIASLRTILRDNFIQTHQAIRFGTRDGLFGPGTGPADSRIFPGACSLDPSRLCVGNNDCFITNFDAASKGTCEGENQPADLFWKATDTRIEGNAIQGPYLVAGISLAGETMRVHDNRINGPLGDPTAVGIFLNGKFPIETAILTRNIVANVKNALRLNQRFGLGNLPPADAFLAEVSLNDFFGYETAIITSVGYNLLSELTGNYWGLSCEAGGFPLNNVLDGNGQPVNDPIFVVGDPHPYGEPVAEIPDEDLPSNCF